MYFCTYRQIKKACHFFIFMHPLPHPAGVYGNIFLCDSDQFESLAGLM
ncbi:hypothetical protein AVEN_52148-1, partial [Araneus ventricosus]